MSFVACGHWHTPMIDLKTEIIERVTITEVVNRYGYQINRGGFISCPFHSEKTASCRIYPKTNTFYCFGCGKGGNVIDFVSQIDNLSFIDTITKINEEFALGLPIGRKMTLREKTRLKDKHKEQERQRQEEQERTSQINANYWAKFDHYVWLQKQRQLYRPTSNNGELHPLFVESLMLLPLAEYELDIAESEVMAIVNR